MGRFRAKELLLAAQVAMRYKMWLEPDDRDPEAFKVVCDKTQRLPDHEGREAPGDARGARPRPQARAAPRGPGSNPGRSTANFWQRRSS